MNQRVRTAVLVLVLLSACGAARADWAGKGELGYVAANGNSEATTLDAKLDLNDAWGLWKQDFNLSALRASTSGTETAERYVAQSQTNYALTQRSFWFGALSYTEDKFSGFQYQADANTGYGYKIFDAKDLKLSTQIGVGYGKLKYSTNGETHGNAVYTFGANFEDALTSTTKLVDHFDYTGSSPDSLLHNFIGLEVKISTALALALGYDVRHNSSPPAPKKTTDTLTTVNLAYSF